MRKENEVIEQVVRLRNGLNLNIRIKWKRIL